MSNEPTTELPPCTCRNWCPDTPCKKHEILASRIMRLMSNSRDYEPENDRGEEE